MRTSATAAGRTTGPSVNGYLLRGSLVAALGGLLFGFDTAVISGATKALGGTFALSPLMLGITVSSALWGTVLGSLGAAAPSDRYGRRRCLRVLGALYLVSSVGCAFAWSWARPDRLSRYRGTGHWRIVRDRPDVHRRTFTGCQAWTSGRALSDERGCRDSAGLFVELSRGIRRIRRIRVALEIRDGRDPGGRISVCPFRNSGKPSMVDRGGPGRGSPRSI